MTKEVRNYILKLYDQELINFTARYDNYGNIRVNVVDFDPNSIGLWPMALHPDNLEESLIEWVKSRTIPKNRHFVSEILATAGLTANDKLGIIDVCKGLSVNDSFWLDDGKTDLSFDDINLFDNQLDEALAIVAYTGFTTSQNHKIGLSSEWTTSGYYPKAWRRINDELVLYKAGTSGYANAGLEPYSEYFATQLAEHLGLAHVPYDLQMWKGKLASTCPLMNTKDVSFVPFIFATGNVAFPEAMAISREFSSEMLDSYEQMILFDALACNPDRHAANFGVLRDNHTGQVIGPAPLFDHNQSLFPYIMEDELDQLPKFGDERYFPRMTNLSFKDQLGVFMSAEEHKLLRNAIGFEFHNHPQYPVPQTRLDALNSYIKVRTNELLKSPVVDREDLMQSLDDVLKERKAPIPMLDMKSPLHSRSFASSQSRAMQSHEALNQDADATLDDPIR